MSFDIKEFEKKIDEFVNSDEGKKYFENENRKFALKEKRFQQFDEWLKHNDFDKLLYRIILMHDENYCEKCYHNGCEPYPNNLLEFIIDFIVHRYEPIIVNEIDCDFPNVIYFFRGYYFQTIHGQGSFHRIYNKADMRMLLQI